MFIIAKYGYYLTRGLLCALLIYSHSENILDAIIYIMIPTLSWVYYISVSSDKLLILGIVHITTTSIYFVLLVRKQIIEKNVERRNNIISNMNKLKMYGKLNITKEEWDNLTNMPVRKLNKWYTQHLKDVGIFKEN